MATFQKRISRGHAYWSIVESRRINGKPRPIILEYLGTAEALLKRLREGIPQKVRSYTHGIVAVMLAIAEELHLVESMNGHIHRKQLRDGFTVGGSLLLAAIGRICQPTSKRNWYEGWAKQTSLFHLVRMSLQKLDSQHFWDQMEALPEQIIPRIEEDIVTTLVEKEALPLDILLCDMTNFFTYINSANDRCTLAQRGNNKQKRADLKQFGLLLLISRPDQIPLFHKVYQGNRSEKTVFKEHFAEMVRRFMVICGSLEDITLIFDQGNNSKETLKNVVDNLHFVGAISPYHHKDLIEEANEGMSSISMNSRGISCYRVHRTIWNLDLTAVVYVSEKLRQGQIRGIEQNITKLYTKLCALKEKIKVPTHRGRKRTRESLEKNIASLVTYYTPEDLIRWELHHLSDDAFDFQFWVDEERFAFLTDHWLGRRIVITNRHEWTTQEIIAAYWGQSHIEYAFKTMKNPFHVAMRPQYHWTDQKIKVHGFICFLSFLLVMMAYKRAKDRAGFTESPHTLLEKLSCIRLATFIENPAQKTKGPFKATYRLEEMDPDINDLAKSMGVTDLRLKSKIPFSVYN